MTNQQGAPEALRPIARYKIGYHTDEWGMRSSTPSGIPDPAGTWVRYEDHLAALVEAQQPAPSAAVALSDDLRDRLVAISEAVADQDDRAAQAMLREILKAPQPSPTPQADSVPAEAVQRIVHLRADRERRVYVAGPMTGLPEYNFPLFNATAARLRSEGWHVENPAEHGHVEGAGWADYLRWDISRIATCGAIYLLPGWSKSKGATLEVRIAGELGMQVLLADDAEAPQADSVTAPAGGATAEPRWKSEDFEVTHYPPMPTTGMRVGMPKGVKVTHRPTGLFAVSEDERSQHMNREVAWNKLQDMLAAAPTPPAQAADSVLEDAARWQMLPAFFEEYQIDAMKLYRDIDAAIAARKQGDE